MPAVRYEDLLGYRLFRPHKFALQSVGVRSDDETSDRRFLVKVSEYFGNFMVFLVTVQGLATSMAAYDRLVEEDYVAVSNVMAYLSLTLSSLSKYQILRTQSAVMHRLGLWIIKVKGARSEAEVPRIESLVLHVNKSFYYFGIMASLAWAVVPVTRNFTPLIPSKVPFLEDSLTNAISYPYIQIPCNLFLTSTIVYTATSVLHILAVFCSEVRFLADRWSNVVFDRKHPGHFVTVMKDCVAQHKQLLNVMKDLNALFDSMFAFQVMIFIIHFCAFNFCLLKTTGSEAVAPLFPLTMSSMMEFGLLCWMGEEITHALQEFHWKIYDTNWYESKISDKKNMVFVLEILKKRRYLTGARVIPASLSTYVETLRQAFSLYTLMKALTTKE